MRLPDLVCLPEQNEKRRPAPRFHVIAGVFASASIQPDESPAHPGSPTGSALVNPQVETAVFPVP